MSQHFVRPDNDVEPATDFYIDREGRTWRCIADKKRGQMVCNCEDGSFTCASFKTFAVWGWQPESSRVPTKEK